MGRPTDDPKHYRVNLRVSESTYNQLVNAAESRGISVAEYVRGIIIGKEHKPSKPTQPKTVCGALPEGLYKDIDSMLSVNGLSYERFMELVDKLMSDGSIIVSPDGVVTTDSRVNVSVLIDRCDEAGIKNYQAVFDKLIKALRFT